VRVAEEKQDAGLKPFDFASRLSGQAGAMKFAATSYQRVFADWERGREEAIDDSRSRANLVSTRKCCRLARAPRGGSSASKRACKGKEKSCDTSRRI